MASSIAPPVTAGASGETPPTATTWFERRKLLLGIAGIRIVVGIVAIPLAPFLYREHVAVLVLLRPSKEVLLLAGFMVQRGDLSLVTVGLAAVPLLFGGVWTMFALGRAYADRLDEPRGGVVGRLLPAKRLETMTEAVRRRGLWLVFLGRLAAFPSTLVGAAAGAAEIPARRFLLADTAGAVVSLAALLGAGIALEETHDRAGPWVTGIGVLVLVVLVVVFGRSLTRAERAQ